MSHQHKTPRMHDRSQDPAFKLLKDSFVSQPRVHRAGCYICEDMEFARMGLPLCSPCCQCRAKGTDGHIAADDDGKCEDCGHIVCESCHKLPAQEAICTCESPCCEVHVVDGYPPMTCGSHHCPTHGPKEESANG